MILADKHKQCHMSESDEITNAFAEKLKQRPLRIATPAASEADRLRNILHNARVHRASLLGTARSSGSVGRRMLGLDNELATWNRIIANTELRLRKLVEAGNED